MVDVVVVSIVSQKNLSSTDLLNKLQNRDFNQPGIKWIEADDGKYFLPMNLTNKFYEMSLIESLKPLVKSNLWHKSIEIEISVKGNENKTTQLSERNGYESAMHEVKSKSYFNHHFAANHIFSR